MSWETHPTPGRIVVDRSRCVGTGNCLFYADRTFDLDEQNTAIVVDPDGNDPADVETAIEACPMRALSLGAAADAP